MQKDQAAECTERSSCTRRTDQLGLSLFLSLFLSFFLSFFLSLLADNGLVFAKLRMYLLMHSVAWKDQFRVIVSLSWQIISGCFCFSQTQDIPTLSLHYVFDLRIYTYLRILMHYLAFSLQIKILHYLTTVVLRYSHDAHFFLTRIKKLIQCLVLYILKLLHIL